MPGLNIITSAVEGSIDIENVEVDGTLDVATVPQLQEKLENLRQSGKTKIIVDLTKLSYISSSGLGGFLGMVDGFRDHGGDLAFVNLSDRVKKIFTVVGFMRILTIVNDVAAAVAYFTPEQVSADITRFELSLAEETPHSGEVFDMTVSAVDSQGKVVGSFEENVDLKASIGIVSPAHSGTFEKGRWQGRVILTGPGTVSLEVKSGEISGLREITLREDKPGAQLPVEIRCPRCGVATEISQFNVFRCKQCDEIYFVDKWAHAISLRSPDQQKKAPPRELFMKVPADVNLLAPLRIFLTTTLRETGFPSELIDDMELCVDEAVTNVVEHAYEYDITGVVTVILIMQKGKVIVTIKDQGKAFDPGSLPKIDLDKHIEQRKTGGLGYHLMKTFMDKVHYQYDGTSNILTMEKSVPTE